MNNMSKNTIITDHIRTADMFRKSFPAIALSNYTKALSFLYDTENKYSYETPLSRSDDNYDGIIRARDFILVKIEKYPEETAYVLTNLIIVNDKLYAPYVMRGLARMRTTELRNGIHDILVGIKECPMFAKDLFDYLIDEDNATDLYYLFRGLTFGSLGKMAEAGYNINFFFDMNPDSKNRLQSQSDSEQVDTINLFRELMENI